MHEGWAWCRLRNIGEYKKGPFGSSLTKSMFVPKSENTVKVYEQKNAIQKDHSLGEYYITRDYFESQMQSFEVFPGDILVSCAGTIGETYILPDNIEQGIINQALMKMKITSLINTDYFLMFFDHILKEESANNGKGTAIKNIPPFDIFKNFLFPLPSYSEQKRIIESVNNIFSIIDNLENNKSDLQSLIKNTKSKILDLAIHGKLVPQDSNDEPAEVLLKRIATSDNRPYKKFELVDDSFKIPNGWIATQMGTYIEFTGGAQPPKETFEYNKTENNIRLIQIRDYKTDDFATYIPKNLARRICSESDIMIGRYGPPLFQILRGIEGAYNVALMKAESKAFCKDYLFYMLQDEKLLHFLESLSDRTCGQDGVNMYELKRYPILVPPLAEQQRIVSKIEELFSYLDTISSNLE